MDIKKIKAVKYLWNLSAIVGAVGTILTAIYSIATWYENKVKTEIKEKQIVEKNVSDIKGLNRNLVAINKNIEKNNEKNEKQHQEITKRQEKIFFKIDDKLDKILLLRGQLPLSKKLVKKKSENKIN